MSYYIFVFVPSPLLVENAIYWTMSYYIFASWRNDGYRTMRFPHVTPCFLCSQFFVSSVCHLGRWHTIVRATDAWYVSVIINTHDVWFCIVQYPQTISTILTIRTRNSPELKCTCAHELGLLPRAAGRQTKELVIHLSLDYLHLHEIKILKGIARK